MEGRKIWVRGIVQGVGFRPFVYNLAQRLQLSGQVCNTGAGVEIDIVGPPHQLEAFVVALRQEPPPLAQIEEIAQAPFNPRERVDTSFNGFTIVHSKAGETELQPFVPISPDVALCPACRHELHDPQNRRFGYPFINCTDCGPRYTIILDVPYDRPATTMAGFPLCPACRAEYESPADRRFHAQPNACPDCGPHLWYVDRTGETHSETHSETYSGNHSALVAAQNALAQGKIVAIKGIGGFHLACDAANPQAVATLRARKGRSHKPFALMVASMEIAHRLVEINPQAQALLESPAAPILLLPKRENDLLAPEVAPQNARLGILLPYSPLHHLLFYPSQASGSPPPQVLVMTSGNLSEEPIAATHDEAENRLAELADGMLFHNRPIHISCDDSVVLWAEGPIPVRRSRGYAPMPQRLPFAVAPVLAVGGELKNTLCVARNSHAFLSGHIGDLANLETLRAFEKSAAHLMQLFRVSPEVIACDAHPGYLGTRWAHEHALAKGIPIVQVQHHHAHAATLMAEHGLPPDATLMTVVMDGTGYGPDGTIWGGEFLHARYNGYTRLGRLQTVPMPGGDAAIRRPYRMALATLFALGLEWDDRLHAVRACPPAERKLLGQQLATGFNCVPTSSMGRFFDTVAALLGLCITANYEAQGAIALESLAIHTARIQGDSAKIEPYPFGVTSMGPPVPSNAPSNMPAAGSATGPMSVGVESAHPPNLVQSSQDQVKFELNLKPIMEAVVAQILDAPAPPTATWADAAATHACGAGPKSIWGEIALRTHATIAAMIVAGCREMARHTGLETVGLTGGVFQNGLLLQMTCSQLEQAGFQVVQHRRFPPNDGGLALGQAVIAGQNLDPRRAP